MDANLTLLTGLPRSGTTLTCKLLNRVPNTVALAEPMDVGRLGEVESVSGRCDEIARFCDTQRLSLLTTGTAISRHKDGVILDNFPSPNRSKDGLRRSTSDRGAMHFGQPLDADFQLVVKHPSAFTAMLPEFAGRFRCFAVVRSPASVLASWNSVNMPVREGRAPAAERLAPQLARRLSMTPDRLDRQLALLEWFFSQYLQWVEPDHVVRYEAIVASGGAALGVIAPGAAVLADALISRNDSGVYAWDTLRPVLERLRRSCGGQWEFYSRAEVCDEMEARITEATAQAC